MQIINFFYELARQNKHIRGFIYGKSYEKGAGNEAHPLLWLDDPIYGQTLNNGKNNVLTYTVNVDIVGIPETDKEVTAVQTATFNVGISIGEKIKQIRNYSGFSIESFSFVTLRNYYDNNAAGCRFTYYIIQANPVDRCADEFDPDKEFPSIDNLPDFKTDNPDGCAIFTDKLPEFDITIR